jgi:integrase
LDFLKDYSQGGHSALAKQMRLLARDYVELLIYTGIRSGKECMNLKWQDVQWYVDAKTGKRYIRIWVNGKTGARFLIAKNHSQAALERLCQRDAALKGKPLEQVLNERHNLPIFRLPSGKQPKSFRTTFKWLMLASGLLKDKSTNQNRTLYSLRHTYATIALTDGAVDIHTLARQMGTSVGMLENTIASSQPPWRPRNWLIDSRKVKRNEQIVYCSKLEPYIYWGLVVIFATH